MNSTYYWMTTLMAILVLAVLWASGYDGGLGRLVEGYWFGDSSGSNTRSCAGLDERDCVLYPNCLWHIERTYRNDIEGRCIARKDLPRPLRRESRAVQRSWWQPFVSWIPGFGGYVTYDDDRDHRVQSGRSRIDIDRADRNRYYDHQRQQEQFYNRYYGSPPVYYGPRYYYSDQQPAPWRRSSYLTAHYLA